MFQPDTAHWNSFVHPFIYSFYQSLNKSSDCSARCWVYNKETRRYKIERETGSKYTNFQRSVQLEIVIGTITVKTWGDKRIMEENKEDGSQAEPFKLPLSDELEWSERSQGKNTAVEGGAGWKGSGVIGAEAGRYRWPYIYISPEDLEEGAEFCLLISYLDDQLHGINAQARWCGPLTIHLCPYSARNCLWGKNYQPQVNDALLFCQAPMQSLDSELQNPAWKWGHAGQLRLTDQFPLELTRKFSCSCSLV